MTKVTQNLSFFQLHNHIWEWYLYKEKPSCGALRIRSLRYIALKFVENTDSWLLQDAVEYKECQNPQTKSIVENTNCFAGLNDN